MVESLIALGSNLGDREASLRRALELLGAEMKLNQVSSVYETEPMYVEDQAWFLNCVVSVETDLPPAALLARLKDMERRLGREPSARYGPRAIDLDILFYGGEVVSQPGLEVPHPRLAERPFVLVPLEEIRPELVHPVLKKKVSELAASLAGDRKAVRKTGLLADLGAGRPRPP